MILGELAYLLLANLLAWMTYASDKRRATLGLWRVPERTLLLLAMGGGAPAAWAAQRRLRHKTRKEPFRTGLPILGSVWIILMLAGFAFTLATMR